MSFRRGDLVEVTSGPKVGSWGIVMGEVSTDTPATPRGWIYVSLGGYEFVFPPTRLRPAGSGRIIRDPSDGSVSENPPESPMFPSAQALDDSHEI